MPGEVDLGDSVHPVRCRLLDASEEVRVAGEEHVVCTEAADEVLLCWGADDGSDLGAVSDGHLGGDGADAAGCAIDQDSQPAHRAVGEQCPVPGDVGDAEAGSLVRRSAPASSGSGTASASGTTQYSAAVPNAR